MDVSERGGMGMVQCHAHPWILYPPVFVGHPCIIEIRQSLGNVKLSINTSVAVFLATFYSVGSKIDKITKIFDKVEDIKNRRVTYWAEKNGPTVIQIISGFKKQSKKRFL
jgi:hypothetical protein